MTGIRPRPVVTLDILPGRVSAKPERPPATTSEADRLCASCQKLWDGWSDYRLEPLPIRVGIGATYDATPAGIRDSREYRFRLWKQRITEAHENITRICRAHRAAS